MIDMNKKNEKPIDESLTLDDDAEKNEKHTLDETENLDSQTSVDQEENLDSQKPAGDEEEISEDEKSHEEKLQEEINTLRDEKLRLLAEMENFRKRADKERIDSIRYGSFSLARDILSPDDNLTRALDAIPKEETNSATVNNLIDGLKIVQKEFSTILEKYGIKKIKALNAKFDHNFHQAMVELENDEVEEGIVIQEMQSGYTMHDRLLRPSMVGVSKKSTKKDKNKTGDDKKSQF